MADDAAAKKVISELNSAEFDGRAMVVKKEQLQSLILAPKKHTKTYLAYRDNGRFFCAISL